jgi:hypothetical protein
MKGECCSGTTAPVGFVTVPTMVPLTACAHVMPAVKRQES